MSNDNNEIPKHLVIHAEDKGIVRVIFEDSSDTCPNKVCDIYYTDEEDSLLTREEAVEVAMSIVLEIKRLV